MGQPTFDNFGIKKFSALEEAKSKRPSTSWGLKKTPCQPFKTLRLRCLRCRGLWCEIQRLHHKTGHSVGNRGAQTTGGELQECAWGVFLVAGCSFFQHCVLRFIFWGFGLLSNFGPAAQSGAAGSSPPPTPGDGLASPKF